MSRFFSLLLPWRDAVTEEIRGSRLAVARRQAAVRREPVVTGEVFDVDGDRKLGSGFGPDARHRQEASVSSPSSRAEISAVIASISAEFSDILRANDFTARSSAATTDASGLVEVVERTGPRSYRAPPHA